MPGDAKKVVICADGSEVTIDSVEWTSDVVSVCDVLVISGKLCIGCDTPPPLQAWHGERLRVGWCACCEGQVHIFVRRLQRESRFHDQRLAVQRQAGCASSLFQLVQRMDRWWPREVGDQGVWRWRDHGAEERGECEHELSDRRDRLWRVAQDAFPEPQHL